MKVYEDKRGWQYKVMPGLGNDNFKARYHRPKTKSDRGWHCVSILPWRKTEVEAQADLDVWAKKKGMLVIEE